jgi:uncharacterized protein (DUF1015 family)
MAQIKPFKGLHYRLENPEDLGRFVAPPYDMLDENAIDGLYAKDPFNVVRIIQNKKEPSDISNGDRHNRAAAFLFQWVKDGTLIRDESPSVYIYQQQFNATGSGGSIGYTRTGVIALVKLVDYEDGIISPHEYTLIGPKIDRYDLLRATKSHSELIFGIVPDEDRRFLSAVSSAKRAACLGKFVDNDGVRHSLYRNDDPSFFDSLKNALSDRTILIADGHHRYETALKFFRDTKKPNYGYVLMSLVSTADPGLVIRAFHRMLKKYPGTEAFDMCRMLPAFFDLIDFGPAGLEHINQFLGSSSAASAAANREMLYMDARSRHLYGLDLNRAGEKFLAEQRRGMSDLWNRLDVSKINSIVVNKLLGLPLDGKILHDVMDYVNNAKDAFEKVLSEAPSYHGVFFIRPVDIATVNSIVSGKERMPQKSTNFFPKCYSGLVFNTMDFQ